MTSHVTDELPRLLTGDATRTEVMTAAAHLRGCPDCQQELVSAVVAHASLISARRFAPEVVAQHTRDHADTEDGDAERAANSLGRRIASAPVDTGDDADPVADDPPPAALPDLTTVFAKARAEASTTAAAPARRRRLVAVAAAAVVLGGGATAVTVLRGGDTPSARTVALGSYHNGAKPDQIGTHLASITIHGSTLRINAGDLPRLGPSRVYELWLTDSVRKNMQAVGALGSDNTAVLPVTPSALSRFDDFEVSVQPTGQLAKYSGTSVLRGKYS